MPTIHSIRRPRIQQNRSLPPPLEDKEDKEYAGGRASDKVQVVSAVGAVKAGRHGKPMVSAASFPPLHKTQERGTHSFATGKERLRGWATCPLP